MKKLRIEDPYADEAPYVDDAPYSYVDDDPYVDESPYADDASYADDEIFRKYGILKKKSILWALYFWLLLLQTCFGLTILFMNQIFGILEFTQLTFLAIGLTGLYGFVYQKKFLSPAFWPLFALTYAMFRLLILVQIEIPEASVAQNIGSIAGFAFSLPLYYALCRYGREDQVLWMDT